MADTLRQDRGGLAAPVTGTLYEGRAARTHSEGDALQYSTGPEHRDASELQRIASQLAGKPLTLHHPDGLISDGAQAVVIGHIVSARVDGDHVVVSFMVRDQRGLDAIAAGTHELSLGYQCHLDENRYQRGTVIDHLAVVPRARCGSTCALRADATMTCTCGAEVETPEENANGEVETAAEDTMCPECGQKMDKKKCDRACPCGGRADGIGHGTCTCTSRATYSVDMSDADKTQKDEANAALDAARNELAAVKAQLDAANAEIASLKAQPDVTSALANLDAAKVKAEVEADNAKANLAGVQSKLDAATAELEALRTQTKLDADNAFNARVDARVELFAAAASVGIENYRTMSDRDIKVAVIKHVDGKEVAVDKVDAYVDGMFAGALDRHANSTGSRAATLATIQQTRQDGAALPNPLDDERAARVASANRTSSAWMTPSAKN